MRHSRATTKTSIAWRLWLRRIAVLIAVGAAVSTLTAMAGFAYLESKLPDVFSFEAYKDLAREHSKVYASSGELLARFGSQYRTVVAIERIPANMRFAMICAEDAAFYSHPGLDLLGIARALWVDITRGRYVQGASTITQQFAKTRFLSSQKSIIRKLNELVLARKLEQKLTKDEILTMYMNEIYFGDGRWGVEEAARHLFCKSVSEVNIAEAALLAGLVNSPSRLSPIRYPDRARRRRSYVLGQLRKRGYISEADEQRANAQTLPKRSCEPRVSPARWVVSAARKQATKLVGRNALRNQGLRIELSIDLTAQRAAQQAVKTGLTRIDKRYKSRRPLKQLKTRKARQTYIAKLRKTLRGKRPSMGRTLRAVVIGFDDKTKRYQLDLGAERGWLSIDALVRYQDAQGRPPRFESGDVLLVSVLARGPKGTVLSADFGPQAALVAIEPQTRLIRALVGGDDARLHPFNRALGAKRQPGSTFKTFVYGAAIEAGLLTPDSTLRDAKRTYRSHGRPWTPRNYTGSWDNRAHSIRDALARSINSIAVEVGQRIGPDKVADFARRLGITSRLRADLPLALGASSVSPLELANAYATIAADGMFSEPVLITRIVDRKGQMKFSHRHSSTRVIPSKVARALADMLGEVVRRGSAKRAHAGRPVAGKTGTTNRARDTWFVGFSPELSTAVWVGHDNRRPMRKGSGSKLALPIWGSFMRGALDRVPVTPLPRLPHVVGASRTPPATLEQDPEDGADELEPESEQGEDEAIELP